MVQQFFEHVVCSLYEGEISTKPLKTFWATTYQFLSYKFIFMGN